MNVLERPRPMQWLRWDVGIGLAGALLLLMSIGYLVSQQSQDTFLAEYEIRIDKLAGERRQALVHTGALRGFAAELAKDDHSQRGMFVTFDPTSMLVVTRLFDGTVIADAGGTLSRAGNMFSSGSLRGKMLTLVGIATITLVSCAFGIGRTVGRSAEATQQRKELERRAQMRTEEREEAHASLQVEITRRRQAEDILRETDRQLIRHTRELEIVNKELERFCHSISHDLRAPLRSIDGFSHALLEDCADLLNEQGTDHLNRIRAASQQMGRLMDDLLKLARLARREFNRKPVDLSEMAAAVVEDIRQTWPKRQVDMKVAPGILVDADPLLLRVVLDNLLRNAWKFGNTRERTAIEVGAMSHDGTTAYFVRDNGVGFDMAYADKLFDAFQRLHAKTEYPGTGIGLALVQRIVTRHGGRVWAESRVDEGATFYFTLGEQG